MANSENIVLSPGAAVSLAPWVTNGGSGSFVALGHIEGPVVLDTNFEHYKVMSEMQAGPLALVPTGVEYKFKVTLMEVLQENYRMLLKLLAAQKTGTTPNFILAVVDPAEVYFQLKIVGKPIRSALSGLGPNPGSRTIIAWRTIVEGLENIQFGKAVPQLLPVTFSAMYDESIAAPTTQGRYWVSTDTAVA